MQLRWAFQALQVPMPVVALRTSALLIGPEEAISLRDTGLTDNDLFKPLEHLRTAWAKDHAGFDTELTDERGRLDAVFQEIIGRSAAIDPTLEASAKGERIRLHKRLDHLEKRLLRAAKRREELLGQRNIVHERIAQAFPALREGKTNGPAFTRVHEHAQRRKQLAKALKAKARELKNKAKDRS